MIDVLIIGLLARNHGNIAQRKGQPRGRTAFLTVAICLGCEVIGVILGYQKDDLGAAALTGFGGLIVGVILSSLLVRALPRLEVPAPNGPSLGEQLVGEPCPQCERVFMTLLEPVACAKCGGGFHPECLEAHQAAVHPTGKKRRKRLVRDASAADA